MSPPLSWLRAFLWGGLWLVALNGWAQTEEKPLRQPPTATCGQDVVTVGDAWLKIQSEKTAFEALAPADQAKRLHSSMALVIAHLRFMADQAIMLTNRPLRELQRCLTAALTLQKEAWRHLEADTPSAVMPPAWPELMSVVEHAGKQFPEEALIPTETFAHLIPPQEPQLHLQLEPQPLPPAGEALKVRFQLVRLKDLSPVSQSDLLDSHGAPMHALLCEPGLVDFHHVHPTPAEGAGFWEFSFTPQTPGPYTLWINVVPLATGREETPFNIATVAPDTQAPRLQSSPGVTGPQTAVNQGIVAALTWSKSPTSHQMNIGHIALQTLEGKTVQGLQPYMGADAHLVAIHADLRTLVHMHPQFNPAAAGSDLEVHFSPPLAGNYTLFLQINQSGKVSLLPLKATVN